MPNSANTTTTPQPAAIFPRFGSARRRTLMPLSGRTHMPMSGQPAMVYRARVTSLLGCLDSFQRHAWEADMPYRRESTHLASGGTQSPVTGVVS
jgi:hypothetical protein